MTRSGSFHFPASRQSAIWIAVLAVVRVGGVVPTAVAGPPATSPSIAAVSADHARQMADGLAIFSRHVRPLLVTRCLKCHGGEAEVQSGLNLATREGLLAGGVNGKAVIPGNARGSRLYRLIAHAEEPYMPQDAAKLSTGEIAQIAAWIDHGAPYDEGLLPTAKPKESWTARKVDPKFRNFWSFQPLKVTRPPIEATESWSLNPIDAFIKQSLDRHKLTPNAEASPRALVRRVTFDLIGLPPTAADLDAFEASPSPAAYAVSRRSAPREPALRQPLGHAALARPGSLCREPRLRARLRSADRVSLSRFRDPGV